MKNTTILIMYQNLIMIINTICKTIIVATFLFNCKSLYSQSILNLRCPFYESFEIDTTFKEVNSWRFLPIKKDSLFLYEEIIITKSSKDITRKKFDKIMRKKQTKYNNDMGMYFYESLNTGNSNHNIFFDCIFFYSLSSRIDMIYNRNLYSNIWKKENPFYSIEYHVTIPRNSFNKKWNLSEKHFLEKYKDIKLMSNKCTSY